MLWLPHDKSMGLQSYRIESRRFQVSGFGSEMDSTFSLDVLCNVNDGSAYVTYANNESSVRYV